MKDGDQPGEQLNTWVQVATYLQVSVRTAQKLEQEQGLPIRRMSGQAGRVFALKAELDEWKFRSAASRLERGPISRILLAGLAAVILGILTSLVLAIPRGTASDLRVEGRNLVVVNHDGRELWRHTFPRPLVEEAYGESGKPRQCWIGDLDGDARTDVLFVESPNNVVEVGSTVHRFSGNKIEWRFVPGRAVTDESGDRMVPPYFSALLVLQRPAPADTRIIVSSNHYAAQPQQIAVLNTKGDVLAEYWHPGHLGQLAQADLDRDGIPELLAGGVHNGYHKAAMVVLRPWRMQGISTPAQMEDRRFRLLNMNEAQEAGVVRFPRSCTSQGKPYTRVSRLRVLRDRIVAITAEGTAEWEPGFIWELDYNFRVLSLFPSDDSVRVLHEQMERSGQVDHPYAAEIDRLRSKLEVRADWR